MMSVTMLGKKCTPYITYSQTNHGVGKSNYCSRLLHLYSFNVALKAFPLNLCLHFR